MLLVLKGVMESSSVPQSKLAGRAERAFEIVIVGNPNDSNDAIRSLLHSTLGAVADIQIRMLEAISEKFGTPIEDLVECIRDSAAKPGAQDPVLEGLAGGEVVFREKIEAVIKTKSGKKAVVRSKKEK